MNESSFPKKYRLLNKRDFASLRSQHSVKIHKKVFKVIYLKNDLEHARLGFAITKKVGKANVRNLLKRKIREWFRLSDIKDQPVDLMIVVHPKWKSFGKESFLENLEKDLSNIAVNI